MTRWVKHLLYKHGKLGWNPRSPCRDGCDGGVQGSYDEMGEFSGVCRPASLEQVAADNRDCLKQGRKEDPHLRFSECHMSTMACMYLHSHT